MSDMTPALTRGLLILELFDQYHPEWTARDIAAQLDIPLASTYRLLGTLEAHGFLERTTDKSYRLGLALIRLASLVVAGLDVRRAALPTLVSLSERTGETALLVVARDDHAVCIERSEGTYPLRPRSFMIGERVRFDAGATPLALLAHLAPDETGRIIDGLANGDADRRATLLERCEQIRRSGCAYTHDEVVENTAAVSAPLFSVGSEWAVGAISVTGITERVQGLEPGVIAAAAEVTAALGGRPPIHADTRR